MTLRSYISHVVCDDAKLKKIIKIKRQDALPPHVSTSLIAPGTLGITPPLYASEQHILIATEHMLVCCCFDY